MLLGADGQVGWELRRALPASAPVTALGRAQLDLEDTAALRGAIRRFQPELVVNAAGYTAVDAAEDDADRAYRINADAPGVLAEETAKCGAVLVHYSTDYVFDGEKVGAYVESDRPRPLNVYGASKLAGEERIRASSARHLILRTSWVYGLRRTNFLLTMARLARERRELRVVSDQQGAPTWCRTVAEITSALVVREQRGEGRIGRELLHLTAAGQTTWHDFAIAIVERLRDRAEPLEVEHIEPVDSAAFGARAARPRNSVLSCAKLEAYCGLRLPHWEEALDRCFEDYF